MEPLSSKTEFLAWKTSTGWMQRPSKAQFGFLCLEGILGWTELAQLIFLG